MQTLRRLNCGCGLWPAPGWVNADMNTHDGVDIQADVCKGLPVADASFDYAVAIHMLQDLSWHEVPLALNELHRLLKPGGVLRLGLPDLDRAIDAYRRGDAGYFHVPDEDARAIGSKLVTQIIWYGSVRTPFTYDFAAEVLRQARFTDVRRCRFGESASGHEGIASLDNRERESLFVEAWA